MLCARVGSGVGAVGVGDAGPSGIRKMANILGPSHTGLANVAACHELNWFLQSRDLQAIRELWVAGLPESIILGATLFCIPEV